MQCKKALSRGLVKTNSHQSLSGVFLSSCASYWIKAGIQLNSHSDSLQTPGTKVSVSFLALSSPHQRWKESRWQAAAQSFINVRPDSQTGLFLQASPPPPSEHLRAQHGCSATTRPDVWLFIRPKPSSPEGDRKHIKTCSNWSLCPLVSSGHNNSITVQLSSPF